MQDKEQRQDDDRRMQRILFQYLGYVCNETVFIKTFLLTKRKITVV